MKESKVSCTMQRHSSTASLDWQCSSRHAYHSTAGSPGMEVDATPALLSLDAGRHRHLVLQSLVEVPSQGGEGR